VVEVGRPQTGGDEAPAKERGQGSAAGPRARAGRSRRGAAPKKNPAPLIVGGVVVLGLIVVAALRTGGGSSEPATPAQAAVVKPDFSNLPDIERPPEIEPGLWDSMNKNMALYIQPPFGKASETAGDRLVQQRERAIPVILNGWKQVDFSTADGASLGWKIQTLLLQAVTGGVNFGWRRATRAEDVAFNSQIVRRWFEAWGQNKIDKEAWAALAAAPAEAPEQK